MAAKKATRKTTKTKTSRTRKPSAEMIIPAEVQTAPARQRKVFNRGTATLALSAIAIAAGAYYFKDWIIAAQVNGKPISRLAVIQYLEQRQGTQALDALVTEALIADEAKKKGISISSADIEAEEKKLEANLKAQGQDLETLLSFQGMTRADLRKQIGVQKTIEKLLADKVQISDEEIAKYVTDNKAYFAEGTSEDDKKAQAREQLSQEKLSSEFSTWIEGIKSSASIVKYVSY